MNETFIRQKALISERRNELIETVFFVLTKIMKKRGVFFCTGKNLSLLKLKATFFLSGLFIQIVPLRQPKAL